VDLVRRQGYRLNPLPATRTEVAQLSRGFGRRATVYLGAEATEARAKSVVKTTYLHFATHGLLDPRSPLDSALALTVPAGRRAGEENGLLQAWEIFEQMRIEADLVTLSACETALGGDVAGEGLVGLTRAFHYAGARTVLASLWRVADDSTSELITRFYAGLRAGLTKDEALRRAQLAAIASPSTTAPFHWAAFTLSGDWR
jgi:CHAT domain-containing protein